MPWLPKWTNTRSPSITGVGEAWLFLAWTLPGSAGAKTSIDCSAAPLPASSRSTRSERPSSTPVVSQIFPPAMAGEDHPSPGMSVFQTTCSVGLQVSGRPSSSECPCCPGPRNSVQSPAPARAVGRSRARAIGRTDREDIEGLRGGNGAGRIAAGAAAASTTLQAWPSLTVGGQRHPRPWVHSI